MMRDSRIVAIFREFLTRNSPDFGMLFLLLVFEGAMVALSVLTLVSLADFLLDPVLV